MNSIEQKIKKQHIKTTANFAIQHIPQVDQATLTKLVDLINISGNFNTITNQQLLQKMSLLVHLIPETCQYSLYTLTELLGISLPKLNNGQKPKCKQLGQITSPPNYIS